MCVSRVCVCLCVYVCVSLCVCLSVCLGCFLNYHRPRSNRLTNEKAPAAQSRQKTQNMFSLYARVRSRGPLVRVPSSKVTRLKKGNVCVHMCVCIVGQFGFGRRGGGVRLGLWTMHARVVALWIMWKK